MKRKTPKHKKAKVIQRKLPVQVDYLKQADMFLRGVLYEDWMSEDDWKECRDELLEQTGKTLQDLSEMIKRGVEAGQSVEDQIKQSARILFAKD